MPEDIFREISELIRTHTNRHVDEWKASGQPVVGYFCQYMPAEIILAAGAMPLRLRAAGSEDSSAGDALMSSRICTFVRHVVSLAVDGKYDFLDGVINMNTCDHVRRAADVFNKKTDIPFNGFVSIPRTPRESLFGYYVSELKKVLTGMEEQFGIKVNDGTLRVAIKTMNDNRRRLARINELRKEAKPRLTGAESLGIHILSQTLPPPIFQNLADRLLEKLESRPGLDTSAGRLLLIGAELDETEYVEAIESQGALVVADLLCFGARSVLPPIDEDAPDPLEAIARAYFFRPSCARMIGDFPARWEALNNAVADAGADGVVFARIVFCDPWGAEVHNVLHRVKKESPFPVLSLSREYGVVSSGQLRTRVQAFLEQIEIAKAKKQEA
ncbi:2-hydroxyacyl-CoA dehydratase subunit D [bacterium]